MIGSNRVGNCCVYFCLSSSLFVTECDGRGDKVVAAMEATDRIKFRLDCSACCVRSRWDASREVLLHR